MEAIKQFLKRKDIEISLKRYGIDALGAMAQGLFCSLLIGTIINTLGTQFHIDALTRTVATVSGTEYTVGGLASAMSGPAMAVAIGYALKCPPLVLFSLITVGFSANALGGAGGPLAVLFVAILAAEIGKAVSKETKIDVLVSTCAGQGGHACGRPDYGCHKPSALLYGHSGLCDRRHCPDAAHLLCGHLRCAGTDRTGRRRCCGRLLRPDGGLCGDVL